jgi:hypothetical protein
MNDHDGLPWKDLVLYHQEITRRSEEKFFSLFRKQDQPSEEWCFLSDETIPSVSGPWSISFDDIESSGLRQKLRMEEVRELYVGGPLWIQNRKLFGSNWLPHVHPFFLKEVRFTVTEDGLELDPLPGDWEISPLAFKGLERSEMVLEEDLEVLLQKIIKDSEEEVLHSIQLSRWLRQQIMDKFPIFASFFNNSDASKVHYSVGSWVLFTPGETGPISRHLLNDYRELQTQVDSGRLGGLKLLEGFTAPDPAADPAPEKEDGGVLPIVPLNHSQEEAVRGILKNNPVTVISGPPGCGKSQVVVSAILNAWSKGLSVLFASNNNQAVDVVKERLAPFEKFTPIAVRAGSSSNSTLESDLIITAAHIASLSRGRTSSYEGVVNETNKLLSVRKRLHFALDSKLPEQIEQGIQAASSSYGAYLKTKEQIKTKTIAFLDEKERLGLLHFKFDSLPSLLEDALAWEKKGLEHLSALKEQRKVIAFLEARVERNHSEMLRLISDLGIDPDEYQDWSWLLRNDGPVNHKEWLEHARVFLEGPIDNRLKNIEWDKEWEFWTSAENCASWIDSSGQYIKDIQGLIAEAEPVIAKLVKLDEEYKTLSEKNMAHGFPGDWTCDRSIIDAWNGEYARLISTEKTVFSWIPLSERSKAVRAMRRFEKQLRQIIPLSIWRKIGQINENGRHALSEVLELTSEYLRTQERWKEYESKRESLEKQFAELRKALINIGIQNVPPTMDIRSWWSCIDQIKEKMDIASIAKNGWSLREDKESALQEIESLRDTFFSLDTGFPLKKAWMKNAGEIFCEAIDNITNLQKADRIDIVRSQIYSGILQQFIEDWETIRNIKKDVDASQQQIQNHPPEETFVLEWLNEKAEGLPDNLFNVLPEEESESWQWFRDLESISTSYSDFNNQELPRLNSKLQEEYEWAEKNLKQVFDLVPNFSERPELRKQYASIFEEKNPIWPIKELIEHFRNFGTRWIGDQLEKVNRRLCDLTFDQAKAQWENRVSQDVELPETIQSLLNHYRRNKKQLKEDGFSHFQKALSALPIWITTAQSPQSIPMIENIFDLVIIDEATQCTLTNLFPLIFRGKRLVVIGDPEQLPAIPSITANNERPLAMKFNVADFIESFGHDNNTVYSAAARCLPGRHSDIVLLREHYRSHPLIIGFSNLNIYQRLLKLRRSPTGNLVDKTIDGVSFVNVIGKATRGNGNRSWMNRDEAEKVVEFLQSLYQNLDNPGISVGVVTPFRAQKEYITDLIDRSEIPKITVGTAHAFQGDERDIMIFSPVAAPGMSPESIRWIEEPRNLVNVAVTRARESMVFIGNSDFLLQQTGIIGKLASYITRVEHLRQKGSEELMLYSWMILSGWNPSVLEVIGDDEVTFTLKEEGVTLAIIVGEGETGLEARLSGKGCKPLIVERRAISETPALVLKSIADNLKYDFEELLDVFPEQFHTVDVEGENHVPAAT